MENNTQSLSGALNNLIKAYEDLQKENIDLKVEIKELKNENTKLKDDLDKVNSSNSQQSQDINGMVSKINSLLKSDSSFSSTTVSASPVIKEQATPSSVVQPDLNIESNQEDESLVEISRPQNTSETKSKIDLNKMESLLNGFGGNS